MSVRSTPFVVDAPLFAVSFLLLRNVNKPPSCSTSTGESRGTRMKMQRCMGHRIESCKRSERAGKTIALSKRTLLSVDETLKMQLGGYYCIAATTTTQTGGQ